MSTRRRSLVSRLAPPVNAVTEAVVFPLLRLPAVVRITGFQPVRVRYRGRRSGREVVLPAAAQVTEEGALITVGMPDQKVWWRNFRRTPHSLEVQVGKDWRAGTGVVEEPRPGAVRVRVSWS